MGDRILKYEWTHIDKCQSSTYELINLVRTLG